jgi:hypothetical protein
LVYQLTILEEHLNMDQVNSLSHPYGEHNDTSSIYLELETHSLAFTIEQLSHDTLIQYLTMHHPGKWHDRLFNVVLHWYERIKEYMWLELVGLLLTQTLF